LASEQDQDATMMSGEASANNDKRRHARRLIFTLRGIAPSPAAACIVAVVFVVGLALPVLARPAPREALPSHEALGWLLETEVTGSAAPWINPRSGYSGTVMITETWDQADGALCRNYTIAAVVGGPPTVLKGTGCRVGPGEWNLEEEAPVVMAVAPPSPPTEKPAAMLSSEPAALPTPAPDVPTPPTPVDDDGNAARVVDRTPDGLAADTAEHKPVTIAGSLPSRSDE
jgi:hypothetical protein